MSEQARLLRDALSDCCAAALILDPCTRVVEWANAKACALVGASGPSLIGRPYDTFLRCNSNDLPDAFGAIPEAPDLELEVVDGGGTTHPATGTVKNIVLDGAPRLLVTLLPTVRRSSPDMENANQALRESEQRLRLALEATRMGTYVWDHVRNRGHFSPEFLALYDLPPDAELPMGNDFTPVAVLDEDRPRFLAASKASHDPGGDGLFKLEFRIRRGDGSLRWLYANGLTEFTGGPGARVPVRSAGVLMDVTDRKRADEFAAIRIRLFDFANHHTLEELLRQTLDEAERLSGSRIGFYHFVAADQKTLSLQAWSTSTEAVFCKADGKGLHYSIDQAGVWVDCVRVRKPVVHNDYTALTHKQGLPEGHAPVARELVVPIMRDEKIVAILGVGNKPSDYTDDDVKAIAYLADVAWELAERKRAEDALRDSEEQLEKIFNSASNGIAFTDPTVGRIQSVNETWVRETGIPRSVAVGSTALELGLWPGQRERADCIAVLEREGRLREYETDLVCRGEKRHFVLNVEYVDLRRGRFLLWEFRDITQREQANQEIAMLKRSIDLHPDSAYWMDVDGRFVYVNEAGSAALGYTPGELLGKTVHDVNPLATPALMENVWETIRSVGSRVVESRHRRKDGSEFPVEILTSYFQFAGKEYACGFARDLSERKRAEAERTRLQEQLAQAQKMESVGRLAGGVAHDFNNMLGVILGHAEMALEAPDVSDALHKNLTNIQAAARRSADLTKQLLAFARKQTVTPKVVNLNDTVEGMLKMVGRLIGEHISLVWRPGEDLWTVFVDSAQIDQILANLCVNARDAISDVGTISIETGTRVVATADPGLVNAGEYVWLSVTDDGCGMDAATQAQAFEPFFTTKEVGKGTGLGLSMVYGIVKQNRGFIEMTSEVGRGTRIAVYLPRHTGRRTSESASTEAQVGAAPSETILLVEDEPDLAEIAAAILTRRGYRVLTALTPGEAIRLAREHPGEIHLLMSDVIMPEMNGRDLAKAVLSLRPSIKRLFTSGYTADVIAHQGVLNQGVFFIQKPFSARDLVAKIRQALAGSLD